MACCPFGLVERVELRLFPPIWHWAFGHWHHIPIGYGIAIVEKPLTLSKKILSLFLRKFYIGIFY
jgi:hypothetical protein